MHNSKIIYSLLGVMATILISGCSSIENSHRQKTPMVENYVAGNNHEVLNEANMRLTPAGELPFFKKSKSAINSGDEVMWRLEAGSINFYLGNYAESVEQFKAAEELIADYDERAIISLRDAGAEAATVLTNLNALPYRGLCRDRIALSIYKSLAYLGAGNESAFRAQLRRLRDEQKKVMEDYEKFFAAEEAAVANAKQQTPNVDDNAEEQIKDNPKNSAFNDGVKNVNEVANRGYGGFLNPMAIFFSGLGSIRDGNYENARIDFQRLYEAMPNDATIQKYYVTVLLNCGREIPENLKNVKPFDFNLGDDCVYVIFANGRTAAFKQIAVYFPVMTAWPMCEFYPAPFRSATVDVANQRYSTTIISDMDGILAQEFKERLPGMITRIIVSTAVKEAAKYAATYAAAQADHLAGAAVFIGSSIYTAAMNTADTRSWELLPKEYQITQFAMPADRHINVSFDGAVGSSLSINLPQNAGSAIVLVNAPSNTNINCHVFSLQ